jgi:hypothetical protein
MIHRPGSHVIAYVAAILLSLVWRPIRPTASRTFYTEFLGRLIRVTGSTLAMSLISTVLL